jgi:hypothetical protein
MQKLTSNPLPAFFVTLIVIGLLAAFGPEEKSLGANVRIVYLHGAWVLVAQAAFILAGIIGVFGLLSGIIPLLANRQAVIYRGSAAMGLTGLAFWVTYLPLSMWAMQANWSGLFLAEPRFQLALTFAIVGILLQASLWLFSQPWLTALGNIVFVIALFYTFSNAEYVMHPPPSPIFGSGLSSIIIFFVSLIALTGLAAFFLFRFWLKTLKK